MKKGLITLACCLFFSLSFSQKDTTVIPSGLKVGDVAPDFKAMDNTGKSFSLKKMLRKGDVVLVFYRGQWCPFCNKALSRMNDSLSLITAKGATVVAVSPETDENIEKTVGKTKASFPIISDKGLSIMKAYKVNYAVDARTIEKYKNYNIDFALVNGNNGAILPVPATYVIGKNGVIKYVFFSPDYKIRTSVQSILNQL